MASVHVTITTSEQDAAGLETPVVVYANADAQTRDDGSLIVHRQYDVVAEYPAERYTAWEVVED
jgi:hypothetical protein